MRRTITIEWLKETGDVCNPAIKEFKKLFGTSARITKTNLLKAALSSYLELNWLAERIFNEYQLDEWDEILDEWDEEAHNIFAIINASTYMRGSVKDKFVEDIGKWFDSELALIFWEIYNAKYAKSDDD